MGRQHLGCCAAPGSGSTVFCRRIMLMRMRMRNLVPVTGVADQVFLRTHLEEYWLIPDDCSDGSGIYWYPLVESKQRGSTCRLL